MVSMNPAEWGIMVTRTPSFIDRLNGFESAWQWVRIHIILDYNCSTAEFMTDEIKKYEMGKRWLAKMMGVDVETFTDSDVEVTHFEMPAVRLVINHVAGKMINVCNIQVLSEE